MKFYSVFKYTQAISVISIACTTSSFGFDLTILKNDKESVSHSYRDKDLRRAQEALGLNSDPTISQKAFNLLGQSLNELEARGKPCDLPLIQNFKAKLEEAHIQNDQQSISNLLIILRSQNQIDDLFFDIIEQSNKLNEALLSTEIDGVENSDLKRAEGVLTNKKMEADDLSASYGSLSSSTLKNPGCAVDAWIRISKDFSLSNEKQKNIRALNSLAKSKNILSDESFALAEGLRRNEVQSWTLTLSKYLEILTSTKNKSQQAHPTKFDLETNTLSSKFRDKKSNTTYRKSLYTRFNPMQISMISDVLKKTFDRMDATKTEVVFTFKSGSETLPVSPMGQYFLARKHLRKDIEELGRSTFFGGISITHEDLITAGLETGLVTSDMLNSALKIDDLWNPEVKHWKKIADYAFRITGTATLFVPPPYNIITSIALVFVDGIISKKANDTNSVDNSYDIF